MSSSFYTYFHTRNDTGAVFYVGKGCGKRANSKGRNRHWKNIVAKCGHTVHIASRWATEDEAFEHEKLLIACFKGLGASLCNCTNGGEGVSGLVHSAKSRAKIGAASLGNTNLAGHTHSAESRAKMSASHVGIKKGALSAEHRFKLSAAQKAVPTEVRDRIAALNRGKIYSAETRAKIGFASKGRLHSADARAKQSAAQKGRRHSPETRAKMSASHRTSRLAKLSEAGNGV